MSNKIVGRKEIMANRYHTGLLVTPNEVDSLDLRSIYTGASFIADPTDRHYSNKHGSLRISSCYELRKEKPDYFVSADMKKCFELLIEADNSEIAENHLSLLRTGMLLALPDPWNHYSGLHSPLKFFDGEDPLIDSQPFWSQFTYDHRVNVGLFTLNVVLNHRNWIYALEKYRFSLELDCVTVHSNHPKHGQIFENTTTSARAQVHQLAAIVSAYSVIEELGLEIRASAENPRFINKDQAWNPEVWEDTNSRLIKAGVNVNKTFNWVLRGSPTSIHVKIPESFGSPSINQQHTDVHDKELHIIEAIQVASWLRNMVASHTFKNISSSVSPYDVFNVQSVARMLIMQAMGIWDYVNNIK
jgi:hypothetical protein